MYKESLEQISEIFHIRHIGLEREKYSPTDFAATVFFFVAGTSTVGESLAAPFFLLATVVGVVCRGDMED
jgi:hypothetical protein